MDMKIERISTQTLREKVYGQLKRKIIAAEVLPGQIMTLQGLADAFGVSLMPVREALWQLESEQIIVIESNKSIHVNKLTPAEMREAFDLRLVLESMAAEKACGLRPDSAVPALGRLLKAMEAYLGNPRRYMQANSEFHFAIYGHAGSPMLLKMIDGLWARIGPYFVISSKEDQNIRAMAWHRGMLEAFAERDPKKMRESLKGDLSGSAGIIHPFLESLQAPGQ